MMKEAKKMKKLFDEYEASLTPEQREEYNRGYYSAFVYPREMTTQALNETAAMLRSLTDHFRARKDFDLILIYFEFEFNSNACISDLDKNENKDTSKPEALTEGIEQLRMGNQKNESTNDKNE